MGLVVMKTEWDLEHTSKMAEVFSGLKMVELLVTRTYTANIAQKADSNSYLLSLAKKDFSRLLTSGPGGILIDERLLMKVRVFIDETKYVLKS